MTLLSCPRCAGTGWDSHADRRFEMIICDSIALEYIDTAFEFSIDRFSYLADYYNIFPEMYKSYIHFASNWLISMLHMNVIYSIGQALKIPHRSFLITKTCAAAEIWPVGGSHIFDNIHTTGREQGEKNFEAFDNMRIDMTTIIKNNINSSNIACDLHQDSLVVLTAFIDLYAIGGMSLLVVKIQREDICIGQIFFPHPERCTASLRVVVTTYADLEQVELFVATFTEIYFIYRAISCLIGAMFSRKISQNLCICKSIKICNHAAHRAYRLPIRRNTISFISISWQSTSIDPATSAGCTAMIIDIYSNDWIYTLGLA